MQSKKRQKLNNAHDGIVKVRRRGVLTEYLIPENGMKVLYAYRKGTGVVTSNVVYKVGARDEMPGETGVAHMLEHMLFKPTKHDMRRKTDSASMLFEREVGATLNATTGKDRTQYYFSYPKEHFERALQIEAERMRDVVLTDKEFLPERTNVLSEFDMYAGDEEFLLAVEMMGAAFYSHPYGHETIGFREDIEGYTIDMLEAFYKKYYAPNNATLIIVGDIDENAMLAAVSMHFAALKPSVTLTSRKQIREPKQEGLRMVHIARPSTRNLLALGVKHDGFPSEGWFEASTAFEVLAGGKDSVLYKKLVDTAKVSVIHTSLEPTYDPNVGMIFFTLAPGSTHDDIYGLVRECLESLSSKDITPYLKKIIFRTLTAEFSGRENSLGFVTELTEYVSADAWDRFFDTEEILKAMTPQRVLARIRSLFDEDRMVIGKYTGLNTASV